MSGHSKILPYFPDSRFEITAFMQIKGDLLEFHYSLKGQLSLLNLREKSLAPKRCYDLWEECCFEAFIKNPEEKDYIEFNFSPSGDWNSFYMTYFRNNVGELQTVKNVSINTRQSSSELHLVASVFLCEMPSYPKELLQSGTLDIGLTTVLLTKEGVLSYWCLQPITDRPDFHDPRTFMKVHVL